MNNLQDALSRLNKAEHIMNEVKSLRSLQKEYFSTRDHRILQQCKIQERKLDTLIDNYFDPQQELF